MEQRQDGKCQGMPKPEDFQPINNSDNAATVIYHHDTSTSTCDPDIYTGNPFKSTSHFASCILIPLLQQEDINL
eukprot:15364480-Ditylum_brightwellii.AAC.3